MASVFSPRELSDVMSSRLSPCGRRNYCSDLFVDDGDEELVNVEGFCLSLERYDSQLNQSDDAFEG